MRPVSATCDNEDFHGEKVNNIIEPVSFGEGRGGGGRGRGGGGGGQGGGGRGGSGG